VGEPLLVGGYMGVDDEGTPVLGPYYMVVVDHITSYHGPGSPDATGISHYRIWPCEDGGLKIASHVFVAGSYTSYP
jgi:hypothetical protein